MGRDALIVRLKKNYWLVFPTDKAEPRHYICTRGRPSLDRVLEMLM
jgi:hypothetical protein